MVRDRSLDIIDRIKKLYVTNPIAKDIVRAIHKVSAEVARKIGESIKIMDFCGTHEWTITHYGIRSLMPPYVELLAGPGCPVCVTPGHYVDHLIKLSMEGIHVYTYGDSYMLPGSKGSGIKNLAEARARGGKVTVVYSFLDVIKAALKARSENHVFFAVGFETTMPAVAEPLARRAIPPNLKIMNAHRFTPPVIKYLFDNVKDVRIHGVIAPGHVSAITGSETWRFIPEDYGVPTVVSGFEPIDVLITILAILRQLRRGKAELVNEYTRVVQPHGNGEALKSINKAFDIVDSYWRGVGVVPSSGAKIKEPLIDYDAERFYGLKVAADFRDVLPGCRCGEVVLGKVKPTDCPLFMKACTPERPYGPCMVSSEGTCRIWALNLPQVLDVLKK